MKKRISRFIRNENAQASVEYVLVACVLIGASYFAISLFVDAWGTKFGKIASVRSGTGGIGP